MPHLDAHPAPDGILAAVGELHHVQRVLDIGLQLGIVHGDSLPGHVLAGDADRNDGQRLAAQVFAEQEVFIVADAQRLTVVCEGRRDVPRLLHAVHRPTIPVVAAALRLSDGILPLIAVDERIALDDAAAREA